MFMAIFAFITAEAAIFSMIIACSFFGALFL
jgi:hypothetical protein